MRLIRENLIKEHFRQNPNFYDYRMPLSQTIDFSQYEKLDSASCSSWKALQNDVFTFSKMLF